MLKSFTASLFAVFIFTFVAPFISLAAVPDEELSIYLEDIGWTRDIMDMYVERASRGTKTLDSFNSLDDLAAYLGPRTTEEQALQALLDKYGYTKEEADNLLQKYNTSIDEYTFVTELDLDLLDILAEQNQTENGGQMPDTAGNYTLYALFGAALAAFGSFFVYKGLVVKR